MTEQFIGIVTDIVRHNDSNDIVTLYTRTRGRICFVSPVSTGKSGRLRKARIRPLSVIEGTANFRENKDIQRLGKISLAEVWHDIYFDPYKSAVALFLTDFLNRYFRNASPDEPAFDFLLNSLRILDSGMADTGNFHITFLINFFPYAGISPDMSSFKAGDYFDLQGGSTIDHRPSHSNYLSASDTIFLRKLLRINFSNSRFFKFSRKDRGEILAKLLKYYSIFFPGVENIRSLDVLMELFE